MEMTSIEEREFLETKKELVRRILEETDETVISRLAAFYEVAKFVFDHIDSIPGLVYTRQALCDTVERAADDCQHQRTISSDELFKIILS
jgi:hypothetical protein